MGYVLGAFANVPDKVIQELEQQVYGTGVQAQNLVIKVLGLDSMPAAIVATDDVLQGAASLIDGQFLLLAKLQVIVQSLAQSNDLDDHGIDTRAGLDVTAREHDGFGVVSLFRLLDTAHDVRDIATSERVTQCQSDISVSNSTKALDGDSGMGVQAHVTQAHFHSF